MCSRCSEINRIEVWEHFLWKGKAFYPDLVFTFSKKLKIGDISAACGWYMSLSVCLLWCMGEGGRSHLWCGVALIIVFLCWINIQQSALRGPCMSTSVCVIWYLQQHHWKSWFPWKWFPETQCFVFHFFFLKHQRDATSDQFIIILINNLQPSLRSSLPFSLKLEKKNLNLTRFCSTSSSFKQGRWWG